MNCAMNLIQQCLIASKLTLNIKKTKLVHAHRE